MRALLLAIAALAFAGAPAAGQIQRAEVTGGTVEGEIAEDLSVFKGIPYAAPPIGDLRWKAPQPVVPWDGVRRTTEFGPACMQDPAMLRQMGSQQEMSEDCLFVDVWTPAASADEELPVLVWVHGGGYTGGAPGVALYDGAKFARQGVVFVSVAYRLGSLGFLAMPELSAESGQGAGNYGMLDMVKALEWVRDNVAQFGGDPERVTVMGHSAGSSAVSILAASPLGEGLIDGVIAQSGANFAPVQETPFAAGGLHSLALAEANGSRWLAELGASSLEAARALPAAALIEAQNSPDGPSWRPAVDGHVLPGDQFTLWEQGRFNDVPLLVGVTSNETAVFAGRGEADDFAALVREQYGDFAEQILTAYEGEGERSPRLLANESSFEWNAFAYAMQQARHGDSSVWYYWFHNSPEGSGHGSEVGLVFGNQDDRPGREPWDDANRALSRQLQSYWVNFAKTGNPNGAGLPQWPRFTPEEPSVLQLGMETQVIDVPARERLEVLGEYLAWRRQASASE